MSLFISGQPFRIPSVLHQPDPKQETMLTTYLVVPNVAVVRMLDVHVRWVNIPKTVIALLVNDFGKGFWSRFVWESVNLSFGSVSALYRVWSFRNWWLVDRETRSSFFLAMPRPGNYHISNISIRSSHWKVFTGH